MSRTFFSNALDAVESSLISVKEVIEAAPVPRRPAAGLLAGTLGLGPMDCRLVGTPSERGARGRVVVVVLTVVDPDGETTEERDGSGDCLLTFECTELDKGGLGGREGRRVAVD